MSEEEPEEQYWYAPTWECVMEVAELRREKKITDLRYRWDESFGSFIVRFKITEKYDVGDICFLCTGDHYPDKYEDRRKWETY